MDPSAPLTVGVNTLLTCEFVLPAPHTCPGISNTYTVTALATGTIAGAYGLFKGYNQVGPMITAAGINGGIAGATFFSESSPPTQPNPTESLTLIRRTGFREYLASPLLLSALADTHYSRRIRELRERRREGGGQPGERLTWWDVRMNKVPDTAVSGAFTGGVLNAWKRTSPPCYSVGAVAQVV